MVVVKATKSDVLTLLVFRRTFVKQSMMFGV